jgi:thioredoxin-like negative regulator of GroEL
MKRRTLAGMIASATLIMTTGCSTGGMSLASMNPFAKSATTATAATEPSMGAKISESFASTATGARNQLSTVGSTAKSAAGKTKATLTGFFKKSDTAPTNEISKTDPLSLENKPASIGPEVFVANGQLWESTGNFPKAMESYSKALESEPNNGPALTSIARLHFRQENYAQAAEFFQKAIQKSPEDAGLFNDLGLTLSKLGNHAAAEQALGRALQLAPDSSRYANNLASVRFDAGNSTGAYEVLAKNNKAPVAHFNMAYLHYKKGQMDLAKSHLTQVVASESEAAGDTAVKRAVERSREMLAQIDGATSTIAQAVPQATMAAQQFLGMSNPTVPVQQVSQTTPTTTPTVPLKTTGTPVTTGAPVITTATQPSGTVAPTNPVPPSSTLFTLPPNFANPPAK